jgi:hypothetical protein
MVHIFELEPLEDEKDKSKSSGDKKKEKTKGKGKEKAEKTEKKKDTPEKDKSAEKKATKKEKAEPKPKRTKFVAPPLETIRKGKFDTYPALYDNFNLPDLAAYCKQEGLKISGKKPQLIKRILEYLETGKKDEPAPAGKGKRKATDKAPKKETAKKQKKEVPAENGKEK